MLKHLWSRSEVQFVLHLSRHFFDKSPSPPLPSSWLVFVMNVRQKTTFGSSPGGSGIVVDRTWEFTEVISVVDSTVVEGLVDSIVVVVAFSTQM